MWFSSFPYSRHVVRQRRITFFHEGAYCSINCYLDPAPYRGLCVLYLQCDAQADAQADEAAGVGTKGEPGLKLPDWLTIEREITDDPKFSSREMSTKEGVVKG